MGLSMQGNVEQGACGAGQAGWPLLNIAMMVSLRITLTYARTGSSLPVMSKMHLDWSRTEACHIPAPIKA